MKTIAYLILLLYITLLYSCISPSRGNYYFKKKNYEQAIIEYNIVLEKNPANYQANLRMGDIFCERREYDIALKYYSKAANTKPDNDEVKKKIAELERIFKRIEQLKQDGDVLFSKRFYKKATGC